MAGLPEAPRASVTAFEAAVSRVQAAPSLVDADRIEIQGRTRELLEHVRADVQNRAYLLRVILRIDVALHALRASPGTDTRVLALQGARRELETLTGGTMTDQALSSARGYLDAARDTYTSGIRPFIEGRRADSGRALGSAAVVAGGVGLTVATVSGLASAVTGDPTVHKPTLGQRVGGFFKRLIMPVAALFGFFALGRFASARAQAQARPELREARSYLLDRTVPTTPAIRGMTFRRAPTGGEVLVERDGNQYRMIFENAGGLPTPSSGEETLGGMIERMYSSGSVGSGLGIERGGLPGVGSIGGVRMSEFFTLTEAGIDAIRTALGTPDAATPAGVVADVPLKFSLPAMTPTQMAFVRRCIARGATISTTDDGILTVTTKVRLKRSVVAPPPAPVLGTLDAARNLGRLATGTYAYACAAGTRVEIGALGPGAVVVSPGMTTELAPGVKLHRRTDTRLEIEILPSAVAGAIYTVRVGGNNITFATEAPTATPAATVALLNNAMERPRVLAGELATFTDAALATHVGSPATFGAFAAKLTAINNLVPAAHRADAGVQAAVAALLTVGTPALSTKRFVTSGPATYKVIARNGQLECEMVPAAPAIETLALATARNDLVIGGEYRIAIPATARRAIVSTRPLAGNGLTVDNTQDSFVNKPVAWTTYSAVDGPAALETILDGGTTYLKITTRRACTFRVRFDVNPVAAGTISADYTVVP